MPLHPFLHVGYRVALAAWLKDEGHDFDEQTVDHLIEGEANLIKARNEMTMHRDETDEEIAADCDLSPAQVAGVRTHLLRYGEVRLEDL